MPGWLCLPWLGMCTGRDALTWRSARHRVCGGAQVLPCSKRFCHDWTVCPFAHPGEKARRRDPRLFTYTGIACPDMKKVRSPAGVPLRSKAAAAWGGRSCGAQYSCDFRCHSRWLPTSAAGAVQDQSCLRGDACPYAHNVFEYWLHPTRCARRPRLLLPAAAV